MITNESDEIKKYLDVIILKNQTLFNQTTLKFYETNKIPYVAIFFAKFYKEYFYLILSYQQFGIYFNDIEETFGICKVDNNICNQYIEFFDDLAPTVQKFQDLVSSNKLDQLFKS